MKLELIVSRPRKPPVRQVQNHRELPVQVICLEVSAHSESIAHLDAVVDPLYADIARAIQLKRPINEAFLESCFDKWVHSTRENVEAGDQNLALFVLIPPPLSGKKRDFLMATWGDAAVFEGKDKRWQPANPTALTHKEGNQSAYFRLPHPQRAAFFGIFPCMSKAESICECLTQGAPPLASAAPPLDISELSQMLAHEGASESSWLYLQCEHLSSWSPSRLTMRGFALATRALRNV